MLLKQVFMTLHGAQKRVAFENAHSKSRGGVDWSYSVVRCVGFDNEPDKADYDSSGKTEYTWRISKVRRT